ncbi:unnamed protein product, partial [Coregonus sp. 'balchen']
MNKILVITVLIALLGLSAQGIRLPRQAEESEAPEVVAEERAAEEAVIEEPAPVADVAEAAEVVEAAAALEQGTLGKLASAIKNYYETSVNTATGWLENIKGLKLQEKAKNAYIDTTTAVSTYSGILQDQVYHILHQHKMFALHTDLSDIMNKLLVITVLITLLGLSVQGLRLPRQAEEGAPEEPVADVAEADAEQGTLEKLTSAVKSYYETSISTATSWLDSIKGMKLEEKAKNAFIDTTVAVSTYSGILHDQVYHILYQHKMFALHTDLSDIMNKLLVITVLITLLGLTEEGAPEEPVADVAEADAEQGTLEKLTSAVKSYYETSFSTATNWLDSLKLKEKAENAYAGTTVAVAYYSGILQDQVYHILYK